MVYAEKIRRAGPISFEIDDGNSHPSGILDSTNALFNIVAVVELPQRRTGMTARAAYEAYDAERREALRILKKLEPELRAMGYEFSHTSCTAWRGDQGDHVAVDDQVIWLQATKLPHSYQPGTFGERLAKVRDAGKRNIPLERINYDINTALDRIVGTGISEQQHSATAQLIPKSFYMLRHGQTIDNAEGVISGGDRDADLTDKGEQQAKMAHEAHELLDPKPEQIIVTGLSRTHHTAEIMTGHRNFIKEPGLNERCLGEIDGKITEAEQKKRGPLPGEESSKDHAERVVAAVNRHLSESESPPLFVTHGGTTRRMLEAAGIKERVDVNNAQIYHFIPVNNRWKIFELSVADGKLQRKDITPVQAAGVPLTAS